MAQVRMAQPFFRFSDGNVPGGLIPVKYMGQDGLGGRSFRGKQNIGAFQGPSELRFGGALQTSRHGQSDHA